MIASLPASCGIHSANSLFLAAFSITNPTARRRARRLRAVAKRQLWLHRRGVKTLTSLQIWTRLKRVNQHHSAQPFVRKVIRNWKVMSKMAKREKTPWKCSQCKRLCKESATHCASCGASWSWAADPAFVAQSQTRPKSPRTQSYHPWNWDVSSGWDSGWDSAYWQWDHGGGRGRAQSPRQKSPRQHGKGKGKEAKTQSYKQGDASGHGLPSPAWVSQSSVAPSPFALLAPSPETLQAPVAPPRE